MKRTKSICPVCQKKIDAKLTKENGKILITKTCNEHGTFSATHWQSPGIFNFAEKFDFFRYFGDINAPKNPSGCPYVCESCNNHISSTVIGVIDVTKRCDLRCNICFSTFPDHEVEYEPSKDIIVKMIEFLSKGNPKPPAILFSGGEPLEREDMPEIIGAAHSLQFMTILATNGLRLAESPELAVKLKKNGLNIVYLQFDSFHDEFYKKVRGQKLLKTKMKAIENCRKHDIEIILVNTLMRGFNNNEVGDIIRFAAQNAYIIRGVIFQPIAFTGRATDNPSRESWRDWRFAEEVEDQSLGEIKTSDLFPLSVMTSPIKVMSKFMKKPWPLFSCSPQCGLVNWMYVSKDSKIIPINHFVNFERFFSIIQSLNWLLVAKEIGLFTLIKTILKMHISPSYESLANLRRRIFLLGCMAFMDQYTFDINRVRRCVVHYVTPDLKIVPFCAYNNVYRIDTEEEYVSRQSTTRCL
jgi:uncharacterized radical SAM superfamily Fe-S cluster-containing enzyme